MRYVFWAMCALIAYSVLPPMVKFATQDIPSEPALFVVNGTLMILLPIIMLIRGQPIVASITHPKAVYLVGAGIALTVALISFYRGLATGPVSVVVPIFGLFLVGSSAIGVVFFEESLSLRRFFAIVTAVTAVYLAATG